MRSGKFSSTFQNMSSAQTLTITGPWTERSSYPPDLPDLCLDTYLGPSLFRIGIYGWRKRCLYFLVILLSSVVVINLFLTIWIIKVLDFTMDGMGQLRITKNGIRLEGHSSYRSTLYAAEVRSRKDYPLNIDSSNNITINTRDHEGKLSSRLHLGEEGTVEALTDRFEVRSRSGHLLFYVDDNEIVMAANGMTVSGKGGVTFDNSIQTKLVKAAPNKRLRLESPTRLLKVKAPEGIGIESKAGDITATCLKDFTLTTKEGTITLDSERIEFRHMRTVVPTSRGKSYPGIYEMCSCANGRLFLSSPEVHCQADHTVCD